MKRHRTDGVVTSRAITRLDVVWSSCILPYLDVHELARSYLRTHKAAKRHVWEAYRHVRTLTVTKATRVPTPEHAQHVRLQELRVWCDCTTAVVRRGVRALLTASATTLHTLDMDEATLDVDAFESLVLGPSLPKVTTLLLESMVGHYRRNLGDSWYKSSGWAWRRWVTPMLHRLRVLSCPWTALVQCTQDEGTLVSQMPRLEALGIITNHSMTKCLQRLFPAVPATLVSLTIVQVVDSQQPEPEGGLLEDLVRGWFVARPNWIQLELFCDEFRLDWRRESEGQLECNCTSWLVPWLSWLPTVPIVTVLDPELTGANAAHIGTALVRMQPRELHTHPWILEQLPSPHHDVLRSVHTLGLTCDFVDHTLCASFAWLSQLPNLRCIAIEPELVPEAVVSTLPVAWKHLERLSVTSVDDYPAFAAWLAQFQRDHPKTVVKVPPSSQASPTATPTPADSWSVAMLD